MLTPIEVRDVLDKLGLPTHQLALLAGVDERTIHRWSIGEGVPKGSGAVVLTALHLKLADPHAALVIRALAHSAITKGGLSYFLSRLLDALIALDAKGLTP